MRHARRRACGSCQTCGRRERAHRSLQNRRRFRTAPTRLIVLFLPDERTKPEPSGIIGHRPTDSAEEAICVLFLKLFERIYAPLTAGLLRPIAADAVLAEEKRHRLDRLYQRIVTDLDELLRAVGLRSAA